MTNKQKIAVLVNPISGNGKQQVAVSLIKQLLDTNRFDYRVVYTQYAGFITDFISGNINNYDGFIIMGGDGSINEAARALINTSKFLGIIPTGSGNGLARHVGISTEVKKAIMQLNKSNISAIDVLKIGGYFSVNVSGVGFDAEIGWEFAQLKKRGLRAYVRLISQKIWTYRPIKFSLQVNKQTFSGNGFMINIANSSQFGNNAVISPLSDIQDGNFEIVIVKPFPKRYYPQVIMKLFNKRIDKSKYIEIISASEALLTVDTTKIHIDGEPREILPNKPIAISIIPKSIKILIPN